MAQWTINGVVLDPSRIDATPRQGSVELWTIRGRSDTHPFHLHLVPFQVLTRARNPPGPQDAGWKDTVDLSDGEDVELLVGFGAYPVQYLCHCHNLTAEDMRRIGNF